MNICMITPYFPIFPGEIKGGGLAVYQLSNWLVKKGHDVHVLVPYKVFKVPNKVNLCDIPKLPLRSLYFLFKLIEMAPQIDIIHCHWATFISFFAAIAGKLCRKPVLLTAHGAGLRELPKNPFWRTIVATLLKIVDKVVLVHMGLLEKAILLGASPEETLVISNAVDPEKFKPSPKGKEVREKYNIKNDPLVLSAGLAKIKGPEYIIKAMPKVLNEVPNAKFLFISPFKDEITILAILAKKLKVIDSTIFLCGIPHEEMPVYYAAADVYISDLKINHSGHRAYGMVHLEAMASGVPILSRKSELIKEGITGLSVVKDSEDISKKIIYLLKNKDTSKKMGKNARKLILSKYSPSALLKKYIRVYSELLKGTN